MYPGFVLAAAVGLSVPPLYYGVLLLFQLSAYRPREFFPSLRRKTARLLAPFAVVAPLAIPFAAVYAFYRGPLTLLFVPALPLLAVGVALHARKRAKVPLAFTARVRRLTLAAVAFGALFSLPIAALYPPAFALCPLPCGVLALTCSAAALDPVERRRNAKFVARAASALGKRTDLVKVGITGSYGKTTAKNMLAQMLSARYRVCATPASFNTPAGIARTVTERLSPADEVFIAEMGARRRGDIAELVGIVAPSVALVTAVGSQHLATFGSAENIYLTKRELVDGLGEDGTAVFNGDNDGCARMYAECRAGKFISGRDEDLIRSLSSVENKTTNNLSGNGSGENETAKNDLCANLSTENGSADNNSPNGLAGSGLDGNGSAKNVSTKNGLTGNVLGKNVLSDNGSAGSGAAEGKRGRFDCCWGDASVSESGTSFTLALGGEVVRLNTRLVGEHIPSAVAQCALAAFVMGVRAAEIKTAVERLKPVAHRLELLYSGNDVIIDDSYNGNEAGAACALRLLSGFAPRVRVLITPGLVELGKRTAEANRRLGELAAANCDYAIFLGPNAPELLNGALDGGMNGGQATTVKNLSAATDRLRFLPGPKAILFENDLPDNY